MSIVRDLERILAAGLLVLVILLAGNAWLQNKRTQAAQENYQAAAGDARAATVYVTAHKAVQKQREVKNVEVERALAESPEWAAGPVPDDVAGLLRHPSGTTTAVP